MATFKEIEDGDRIARRNNQYALVTPIDVDDPKVVRRDGPSF